MIMISTRRLIEYAIRYDAKYGSYPESEYEGLEVVEEILRFIAEDCASTELELLKKSHHEAGFFYGCDE